LGLIQDLRFVCRVLLKARGFTALAVSILGLGIGANTAVFSILDGTLLRPPPYRQPQRLVDVLDASGREKRLSKLYSSYVDFQEYRQHATLVESIAAATWAVPSPILSGRGPSRPVMAVPASDNFFQVLGVEPALGRAFTPADAAGGCTVVLTNALWKDTFGADPGVAGKSIALDGRACTIAGVMPASFVFYPPATQLWRVITPDQTMVAGHSLPVYIVARLRPGVSPERVQEELRALHAAIHTGGGIEHQMRPAVEGLQSELAWVAGRNLRTTVWVLVGAVGLVLLIACLNVANLLLERSLARQRELAIRAALGAARGRLVRQLLTEGLLLASAGGVLGVGLGYGAVRYFRAVNPVELPVGSEVRLNLAVLLYTAMVSLATALIFGLAPAWRSARLDLAASLKTGGRGVTGSGGRTARALVAGQVALSVALLAGAGLLIESVNRMGSEPLGFRTERVYAARIVLPHLRYKEDAVRGRFYERLEASLVAQPGVARAALGNNAPPFHVANLEIAVEGSPYREDTATHDVGHEAVSLGYFQALGIPLLRGRLFDERDRQNSEPVTVVDAALAREYFPETDPIGQRIRVAGQVEPFPWVKIVGVVGAVKRTTVQREMGWAESPTMYRPMAQHVPDSASLVLASAGSAPVAAAIRRAAADIDSEAGIGEIEPVERRMLRVMAYPRFRAVVFGAFAGLALLLAATGLYGVLSQMVAQRRQEIGVRMAVGALPRDVVGLVLWQAAVPLGIGLAIGLAVAVAAGRWSAALLYGVSAGDPATLAAVAAVLAVSGAAASAIPARRAAKTNPTETLRAE
jgi:predicted permease